MQEQDYTYSLREVVTEKPATAGDQSTSKDTSDYDRTSKSTTGEEKCNPVSATARVEEIDPNEFSSKCGVSQTSKKPINWFSALPPQSLRQAQTNFQSAVQLVAACVTLQANLVALDNRYASLLHEKKKQTK